MQYRDGRHATSMDGSGWWCGEETEEGEDVVDELW